MKKIQIIYIVFDCPFREDLLIFSGGMPRASYNDKNTVSIIQGSPESGKCHVLDFTSKVIDFNVIDQKDDSGMTMRIVFV